MKFYKTNKPIKNIRFWRNKPEQAIDFYDYPDKNIETYLTDHEISFEEISNPIYQKVDGLRKIKIQYSNYEEISDYIKIVLENETFYYYAESLPEPLSITTSESDSTVFCVVSYILDEWSSFGYRYHSLLINNDPTCLFTRAFKNRYLYWNRNDKEIYNHDYQNTSLSRVITVLDSCYITSNEEEIIKIPLDMTDALGKNVVIEFSCDSITIDFANSETTTLINDWGKSKSTTITNFQDGSVGSVWFIVKEEKLPYYFDYDKNTVELGTTCSYKDKIMNVSLNLSGFLSNLGMKAKPIKGLLANFKLVIKYFETPVSKDYDWAPDFQLQPYYNTLLQNENPQLIPIKIEEYYGNAWCDNYLSKIANGHTWTNGVEIIWSYAEFTDYGCLTIDTNTAKPITDFIVPEVVVDNRTHKWSYNKHKLTNEIFSYKENREDINYKYDYYLVKPKGYIYNQFVDVDGHKKDVYLNCGEQDIFFLIPITKENKLNYDIKYDSNMDRIWGQFNSIQNIKSASILTGDSNTITKITLDIPPLAIAMASKDILLLMKGGCVKNSDWLREINYDKEYHGTWRAFLKENPNEVLDFIPITGLALTNYLPKNEFMKILETRLEKIQNFKGKTPTTNEYEPTLWSPRCFNTQMFIESNNTVSLGLDFLDIKNKTNDFGVEYAINATTIFKYKFNNLTKTKMLSESGNELSFKGNFELPGNFSAFDNYIANHATQMDNAYKSWGTSTGTGIATGVLGGVTGGALLAGTGTGAAIGASLGIEAGPIGAAVGAIGGLIAGGINSVIKRWQLDSQYKDIKESSGSSIPLPAYTAGCFVATQKNYKGAVFYTNYLNSISEAAIGNDRRANGAPLSTNMNYRKYKNREVFNTITINPMFNYSSIYNTLKRANTVFSTTNDAAIIKFITTYLDGIRLFTNDYVDPIKCENNYEIDPFTND